MDWWLLTFFIGAILSLFLPEVPVLFQLFLFFLVAIGFLFNKRLCSSAGLWFGALWVLLQAYLYHNQLADNVIDLMQAKQHFIIEGEVLSLVATQNNIALKESPKSSSNLKLNTTTRFNVLVRKVNNKEVDAPFKVRLSWKNSTFDIYQGNILSLKVKLKPAHGLANIGTFNYLRWLKANNIVATGYVVSNKKSNKNSNKIKNKPLQTQISLRQQLFNQYQQLTHNSMGKGLGLGLGLGKGTVAGDETVEGIGENANKLPSLQDFSPVLYALTFGDRSRLNKSHWHILQSTGTSHLIAISGLHVGLLAGTVFYMVMIVFRYLPLRNNRWQQINIRYLAILLSLLSAVIYTYLAGFSLPTLRALVMLNLYWLSRLMGVRLSLKRLVLISLFIIVLISPFSLLTASFWLSFYAVAIIFITLWRFKSWLRQGSAVYVFFKGLITIQLALTLMLLPVTAFFFQQISLVSLLANIVAVPWMSMVSIPSALLSLVLMPINETLAQWCLIVSLNSLSWLWYYLELLSNQRYSMVSLSYMQQLVVLILASIAFVLCYLTSTRWLISNKKLIALPCTLVLFLGLLSIPTKNIIFLTNLALPDDKNELTPEDTLLNKPEYTPWQATFLDVGQGLSVLIKRNEHVILYDTGAAYPSGFNMSDAVILPHLKYSGIKKIDKVVLSHSDNDHAGGINQLLAGIRIDDVFSNVSVVENATHENNNVEKETSITRCAAGDIFVWQDLTFSVLWPKVEKVTSNHLQSKPKPKLSPKNDDSCVILIADEKGHQLLLTGDISTQVEQQLTVLYPNLKINVLQVPHHGSKTSSSELFIKHLSPSIAVVSAGYYNRWNMPVPSVVERYKNIGVELFNNADVGQVNINFDEKGISTKNYVNHLQPFWFNL